MQAAQWIQNLTSFRNIYFFCLTNSHTFLGMYFRCSAESIPMACWGISWYFLKHPRICQMGFIAKAEQPCSWRGLADSVSLSLLDIGSARPDLLRWQSAFHRSCMSLWHSWFLNISKLELPSRFMRAKYPLSCSFFPHMYIIFPPKLFLPPLKRSRSMNQKSVSVPVCTLVLNTTIGGPRLYCALC